MNPTLAQVESLFTVPSLAAAGAAAVAVPIAIHLLWRLRRRPQVWGAMRFLQAAYRRHKQRLRFEQWLLLLVRCLLVLLLGLALAGPMLGGWAGRWISGLDVRGRVVHVVIDDSLASQATGENDQAHFERLKQRALKLIDTMHPEDRMALWRGARPAEAIIAKPTQDRTALRNAIKKMQPRDSRSAMPTALREIDSVLEQAKVAPRAPWSWCSARSMNQLAFWMSLPRRGLVGWASERLCGRCRLPMTRQTCRSRR